MITAVFEGLPALVNGDESLVRRGRDCNTTFLVEAGESSWLVTVRGGRIERVERGPFRMRPWSFAVRAPVEAWRSFWQPVPAPGFHDLFAMTKAGHARIEGDLTPLMQNLRYIKELLAAPRGRI
jgi:hypothetical protein